MAYPVGVNTFTLTFGPGSSFITGEPLGIQVSVKPSIPVLIWDGTGESLVTFNEPTYAAPGTVGTIELPEPYQSGWTDGKGSDVINWNYIATVTYTLGPATVSTVTKIFTKGPDDADTIDLDLMLPVADGDATLIYIPDRWTQLAGIGQDILATFYTTDRLISEMSSESDLHQAVAGIVEDIIPAGSFYPINIGTNLNTARPATTSPVEWTFTAVSGIYPLNIQTGDRWVRVTPGALPFVPSQINGLQGQYEFDGVAGADGVALDANSPVGWTDYSSFSRNLTVVNTSYVTGKPVKQNTGFTTTGAVYFPSTTGPSVTSAVRITGISVLPTLVFMQAGAAQFGDGSLSATPETLISFNGNASGAYSISRSGDDTKLQIASPDGSTVYQSASGTWTGKAYYLHIVEPTRMRLYWNGTLVIDVSGSFTFQTASVVELGMVVSTSSTGTMLPGRNFKFNSFAWWAPTSPITIDSTLISKINTYYAARIGS